MTSDSQSQGGVFQSEIKNRQSKISCSPNGILEHPENAFIVITLELC